MAKCKLYLEILFSKKVYSILVEVNTQGKQSVYLPHIFVNVKYNVLIATTSKLNKNVRHPRLRAIAIIEE